MNVFQISPSDSVFFVCSLWDPSLGVFTMMITLRSNRIFLLAAVLVFGITLYLFYPSDHFRSPHSPADAYDEYEAGGIDSEHWREPVVPHLEDEQCAGATCNVDDGASGDAGKEMVIKRPPLAPKPKSGVKPVTQEELAHQSLDEAIVQERLEDEQARDQKQAAVAPKAPKKAATGLVMEDSVLQGGVIMPKLENATAK